MTRATRRRRPLILTYHAVEHGPGPLRIPPELFRRHIECIAGSGRPVVTVSELARRLRTGDAGDAVALTFDDGAASVARVAGPLLAEWGLPATIYCVADYLGRCGAWPTLPPGVAPLVLAGADELAALAARGFEIGSHGRSHAPLTRVGTNAARDEVVGSKVQLEACTGAAVTSFAYPYGVVPAAPVRELVDRTYAAACRGANRALDTSVDLHALPRVDVHYFRAPPRLAHLLAGRARSYLALRRVAARARRVVAADFA